MTAPPCVVREATLADAPAIAEAVQASLPELMPWMPWASPAYDAAVARAWLREQARLRRSGEAVDLALIDGEGAIVGLVGLNQVVLDERRANLGYWVRTSHAGRGLAAYGARWLIDWAFAQTRLDRLEIVVALGNHPSHRVAAKVGAVRERVVPGRLVVHGMAQDAVVYAVTRPR